MEKIILCVLVTQDANNYVPRDAFDYNGVKLWVTVNNLDKPPIEILSLLTNESKLGLDQKTIMIHVNTHNCDLKKMDIINVKGQRLLIKEII